MDMQTPAHDWAQETFFALNDNMFSTTDKWAAPFPPPAFVQPSALSGSADMRWGQITPPEDLSPVERPIDSVSSVRESSIPIEQLKNEALFPDHELKALQEYQPQQPVADSPQQNDWARSPKRRRSAKQAAANHIQADPTSQAQPEPAPQPAKRKRGRPKSQPQLVEAYTADGYPVQVSSARESHLEKNRVAAHKCRQRKKEYIHGLEERARESSSTNKALKETVAMLREEVLGLKNEVLRHAGCGYWAVDQYLTRCAGDLLGMGPPSTMPESQKNCETESLAPSPPELEPANRESSAESLPSHGTTDSPEMEDYAALELLQDLDEETEA